MTDASMPDPTRSFSPVKARDLVDQLRGVVPRSMGVTKEFSHNWTETLYDDVDVLDFVRYELTQHRENTVAMNERQPPPPGKTTIYTIIGRQRALIGVACQIRTIQAECREALEHLLHGEIKPTPRALEDVLHLLKASRDFRLLTPTALSIPIVIFGSDSFGLPPWRDPLRAPIRPIPRRDLDPFAEADRRPAGPRSSGTASNQEAATSGGSADLRVVVRMQGVTFNFRSKEKEFPHSRQIMSLVFLLERPEVGHDAADILSAIGTIDPNRNGRGEPSIGLETDDATPASGGVRDGCLDPIAVAAYKERLAELVADLESATKRGDEAEMLKLETEQSTIAAELRDAALPSGDPKPLVGRRNVPQETVTTYLKRALTQIAKSMDELGVELKKRVRTGKGANRYLIPMGEAAPFVRREGSR